MPQLLRRITKELRLLDSVRYAPKRSPRKYRTLEVDSHTFRLAPGVKSIIHKFVVKSEEKGKAPYKVLVQFFKVRFSNSPKKGFIEGELDGETIYYRTPSIRVNPVALKGQCEDFRFFFEKQLFDNKALIGNWRRYKRKTLPRVRPKNPKNPNPLGADFVNPDNHQGFCKHVWGALRHLKKLELLRE